MKVVLLHDWLTGFRGGERVFEVFCEMFPKAPVYTLIHSPGSTSATIEMRTIHSSLLNDIPGIKQHYRKFLPLFPKATELLSIQEEADLVLSSSHCTIKGLAKPQGAKQLCYIHSPMRYIYDQFDVYFGPEAPFYQRLGAQAFRQYLTDWDQATNANVDLFVANSHFVKARVQQYYQREAQVVHPFVELENFQAIQVNPPIKQDYFLMVTAFAPNKRVDLAVQAFNQLGWRLKIIGSGQQERSLRQMAKPNVEFLGNLSREQVIQHFAQAQAFVFPGVEDFGITPLESLASGTPVIALKQGGVLETLNQDTAEFFEHSSVEDLTAALLRFKQRSFSSSKLYQRANDFSRKKFKREMHWQIDQLMRTS